MVVGESTYKEFTVALVWTPSGVEAEARDTTFRDA
jgi:hypothetical protein